jgi:hypothetical protein
MPSQKEVANSPLNEEKAIYGVFIEKAFYGVFIEKSLYGVFTERSKTHLPPL